MCQNTKLQVGFTLLEVMVALSVLLLGISGVAALTRSGLHHLVLSEQYQNASYLAHSHLVTLRSVKNLEPGYQTGIYQDGQTAWELWLRPLADDSLQPVSNSLTTNVTAISAELKVLIDEGSRELKFHSLILSEPSELPPAPFND